MTTYLVTGATGNVGYPIARRLADDGRAVRALVRDVARARAILPESVELVAGDVTDAQTVAAAINGCSVVFHAAGLPEQWRRDPSDFRRVNVDGTRTVVQAALTAGVERFVYTSTIDVFAWEPGVPFDESTLDPDPRPTHYERSKQEADRIVTAALEQGLPVVSLHPSAVYGPVPVLTAGLNDFLVRLACRKIPALLPGGMPVVHGDDVAEGHLRAAARAPVGSRYILSGEYRTLTEIADAVKAHHPAARVPFPMPIVAARAMSVAGEAVARVTRRAPLIPRGTLHFLESHPVPLAAAAKRDLDWEPRAFEPSLGPVLQRFEAQGWI